MILNGLNLADSADVLQDDDDPFQLYLLNLDLEHSALYSGEPLTKEIIETHGKRNRSFLGSRTVPLYPLSPGAGQLSLRQLLQARKSSLRIGQRPLSLQQLSDLLFLSCRTMAQEETGRKKAKRPYPSGGAIYPVEVYVISFDLVGLAPGAYHYDPNLHALDQVEMRAVSCSDFFFPTQIDGEDQSSHFSAAIVLSSYMEKSYFKYGDRAWKLMLLEAGHIGQALYLAAADLRIAVCGQGSCRKHALVGELGLDGYGEMPIYPLLLGSLP